MVKLNLKNLSMLILSVSLVTIVLANGCAQYTKNQETPTQTIENVTPQEAFTLIQDNKNNPEFIILDVRTVEEFTERYTENTILIDYYSESFRDELNQLDKNKLYLIYCRSGNRSGKALDIMEELNFKEVYNVLGGIITWNTEESPTTK